MASDPFVLLQTTAEAAARRLLGCELHALVDGQIVVCKIVETEAYQQDDPASHSYNGETARTAVMFGPPGHLYVYFTYGMHYCCNVVVGPPGTGAAVLIRAVEPYSQTNQMVANRRGQTGVALTNGPAKLCQALGVTLAMNGHDLSQKPLQLVMRPELRTGIVRTTRVGITKAADKKLRFYVKNNPYVSKK